jgi:methylthioribose-1-phosphate isomerase
MMKPFRSDIETVALSRESDALSIIDQTRLPGAVTILHLKTTDEIWEAICHLRVRGAPAIGVAAGFGIYLAARGILEEALRNEANQLAGREPIDYNRFIVKLQEAADLLVSARPTAVNLRWAVDRMMAKAVSEANRPVAEIVELLRIESLKIKEEDADVCRRIGEHGLTLLTPNMRLLTHCNAGALATAGIGTATAPIYLGQERGYAFKVYADETRPLLQGMRLTASELISRGVDTTLLCDNMAASLMAAGAIDAILVGCDRVAANGDAANKIGTLSLAVNAHHFGVPFYVCAPLSTIDIACTTGAEIKIEERPSAEVTDMWFADRLAPEGVGVYNPAFDVTPARLITAIVTEKGVLRSPYSDAIAGVFSK